ncbi:unnamed protein product [Urochloa decumbens]|uniref:CASP-like protein n=1 Tax=Urochloa decumbens TaxID=240449 RepID=A0ABC9FJL2_9POAL
MDVAAGRPGTRSSLVLRTSQCVFSAAAFAVMCSAYARSFNNYKAFWFLIYSMLIQFAWSLILGCADIYSLKNQAALQDRRLIRALLIGDWVVATLVFAAASASAAVATFFDRDTHYCVYFNSNELCSNYKVSVILAFITWSFQAASASAILLLNASLQ